MPQSPPPHPPTTSTTSFFLFFFFLPPHVTFFHVGIFSRRKSVQAVPCPKKFTRPVDIRLANPHPFHLVRSANPLQREIPVPRPFPLLASHFAVYPPPPLKKSLPSVFIDLRTLGSAKKLNPPVLSTFRTLAAKTPGCHTPPGVTPSSFSALSSKNSVKSENLRPSNSFLFNPRFHSFSLFFTLNKISPAFTNSSEKYPGVHPPLLSISILKRICYPTARVSVTSFLPHFISSFHFSLLPTSLHPCETRSSLSRGVSI